MPEIVYNVAAGEWSVRLPTGELVGDLIASTDPNPFVQQAGTGAIALNLAHHYYTLEQDQT